MLKLQAKGVAVWADEHHWRVHCVDPPTFIGMNHISPTCMYIIPMYLRLTTFTKTLPQMPFHLYLFAIFILLWGSTHDSADCWSAHRSSAARDSFKRVHGWCKAGWRRPGAPQQKSCLRRWYNIINSRGKNNMSGVGLVGTCPVGDRVPQTLQKVIYFFYIHSFDVASTHDCCGLQMSHKFRFSAALFIWS